MPELSLNLINLSRAKFLCRSHWSFLKEWWDFRYYFLSILKFSSLSALNDFFIYPVVFVNSVHDNLALSEEENLAAIFRVIKVSWCLLNFTSEYQFSVQLTREESRSTVGMNSTFVVVPNSYHCNLEFLWEINSNGMIFSCGKWCEPHMQVVIGEVTAIYELIYCSRISSIAWQYIDVWWACRNLWWVNFDLLSIRIKYFNACQSDIIDITPGWVNIEMQPLPTWHAWHNKILIKVLHSFLKWFWRECNSLGLSGRRNTFLHIWDNIIIGNYEWLFGTLWSIHLA